jgi:hypothetical protein
MKMMLKFLIILVTLLIVTGAAFAAPTSPLCNNAYNCECYEVTATDVDNAAHSWTRVVEICIDSENQCGWLDYPYDDGHQLYLSLFFDGLQTKITGSASNFDAASLKFHGDDLYVLTGDLYCYSGNAFCNPSGHRFKLHGHKLYGCTVGM